MAVDLLRYPASVGSIKARAGCFLGSMPNYMSVTVGA
jgi:hypothetical protein